MDPEHSKIIDWAIALVVSSAGVITGIFYYFQRDKVSKESFKVYVESSENKFKSLMDQYGNIKEIQIETEGRLVRSETCTNFLEQEVKTIRSDIGEIKDRVTLINGGIVKAIQEFRISLENQMQINQNLLMRKERKEE